jgi:hypothetical protein
MPVLFHQHIHAHPRGRSSWKISKNSTYTTSTVRSIYTIPKQMRKTIFSLPNEILAAIFEVAQHIDKKSRAVSEVPHEEVVFSHVCQRWRGVAVATPLLWTTIESSARGSREAYLERSKAAPIDVFLHLQWFHTRTGDDHKFIEAILSQAWRWRRLSISGNLDYTTLAMLHDLSAPCLQSVTVSVTSCAGAKIMSHPKILLGGAPVLSSVEIDWVGLACCWPPLGALSSLSLHNIRPLSFDQFCEVLTSSSSLSSLSCRGEVVSNWPPLRAANIELPSLRQLQIGCSHESSSGILLSISAPELVSLSLSDISPKFSYEPFFGARLRGDGVHFPSLETLVFQNCNFLPSTYRELAFASTAATRLVALGTTVLTLSKFLLETPLTEAAVQLELPWPQLRTLEASTQCENLENELRAIVDMRAKHGRPLKAICLDEETSSRASQPGCLIAQLGAFGLSGEVVSQNAC